MSDETRQTLGDLDLSHSLLIATAGDRPLDDLCFQPLTQEDRTPFWLTASGRCC